MVLIFLLKGLLLMCYDLISTDMFFNVLGVATWFYMCYKFGMYCADKGYSYVVTQYKKFLTNG